MSAGRPGETDSPDAYLQGEVEHLHQELRALQDRNYQLVQDNIKLTRHLRQEHQPQQTATEEHAARTRRREVHAQKTRSRWGSWNAKPKGSTQQTRDIEPMLGQCWTDVVDGGPALTQHWFNVSCLLGISGYFTSRQILPFGCAEQYHAAVSCVIYRYSKTALQSQKSVSAYKCF